jgi:hypothetical protein
VSLEFYVKCPLRQPESGHWNTTMFEKGLNIETSRHFYTGSAASPALLTSFCNTNNLIDILNQNQTCIESSIVSTNVDTGMHANLIHTQFLPSSLVVQKIDAFTALNTLALGQLVVNEPRVLIASRDHADAKFFYNKWIQYVEGFSDGQFNFWIGLETLHKVTTNSSYGLRVVATTESGVVYAEEYSSFRVGSGATKYKLEVSGLYSGAYGYFWDDNGQPFSTYDYSNFLFYLEKSIEIRIFIICSFF